MEERLYKAILLPRLLRLRDAPFYSGMDKNRFNRELRPKLTEIAIGIQGIAFDRLELDAVVEDYINRNRRPIVNHKGERLWDEQKSQGLEIGTGSGTSTNRSSDKRFAKALAQAASKKRS